MGAYNAPFRVDGFGVGSGWRGDQLRGLAQPEHRRAHRLPQRDLFIDNLLVRIHFIIVMIRWTGHAPWEFEFPFPGSLTSTFLETRGLAQPERRRAHRLPLFELNQNQFNNLGSV